MIRSLIVIIPLLLLPAFAKKLTPAQCQALANYNAHVKAEIRGERPNELEPDCKPARKKAPKKAPKNSKGA